MSALIVPLLLLAVCIGAVAMPDHRDLDDRDRRGWWPGAPRRR